MKLNIGQEVTYYEPGPVARAATIQDITDNFVDVLVHSHHPAGHTNPQQEYVMRLLAGQANTYLKD